MPDDTDKSVDTWEHLHALQLKAVVATARSRLAHGEMADEDDKGNRYCLDCGELIPPARVESVNAVRCTECAGTREKERRPAC
jgi:DnaK suppressor protein